MMSVRNKNFGENVFSLSKYKTIAKKLANPIWGGAEV
jgi:hypothetical protein